MSLSVQQCDKAATNTAIVRLYADAAPVYPASWSSLQLTGLLQEEEHVTQQRRALVAAARRLLPPGATSDRAQLLQLPTPHATVRSHGSPCHMGRR